MADALTLALGWLAARELSEAQVRTRLTRRGFEQADVDAAVARLREDGTLDDRRVALAAARLEGAVRARGRLRALQRLRHLGIAAGVAEDAVREAFGEIDEAALLRRALDRRLAGRQPRDVDAAARARIVRALAAQGFAIDDILRLFRASGPLQ